MSFQFFDVVFVFNWVSVLKTAIGPRLVIAELAHNTRPQILGCWSDFED